MPKRNLPREYRYNGQVYGPGEGIPLPDDVAKAIDKFREEFERPEDVEEDPNALTSLLDQQTAELLIAAGYGSARAVRDAGDDELLAVEQIGDARLAQIRDAVG